jgi:hypothetical protein
LGAADWRLFLPTSFESGAYIELFGSSERDRWESGRPRRRAEWRDDFLKEKISLFSNGYVYHPKFLLYHLSLGAAAKQEDYTASFLAPLGRTQRSGFEYEARIVLLPEHPYNLELFTLRYEPVFKERSAIQHGGVESSSGGDFRFQREPYRFHARYVDDTIESAGTSSEVERGTVDGEYLKRLGDASRFSLAAVYGPSRFRRSGGLDGTAEEASLQSFLGGDRFNFGAGVTWTANDQRDAAGGGRSESDQLAWNAQLGAELPLHFRTDLGFAWHRGENTFPAALPPLRRTLTESGRDLRFALRHKLYESLDSAYTYDHDSRSSSGGESRAATHALDFAYAKSVPRGRIQAGLNLGETRTTSAGRTDVADEPHLAVAVPGSFRLAGGRIDADSIAVFLRSPLPPFETVRLDEGLHYTLSAFGDGFEINVFALPAQFVLPGVYDFHVAYASLAGSFELRSRTLGHRASVELYDGLLSPYYSYSRARSTVLAGSFPGSGLESSTWTAGLASRRGPLRARVEYQRLDWDVSPFHSWRGEVQYNAAASPTTNLNATVTRVQKYYARRETDRSQGPYTETTTSASGNVQQQLFARRLAVALGGSYSRLEGLASSRAYTVNSSLSWRVGKLELLLGATGYWSQTRGETIPASDRAHRYYYLKARRRLF